MMRFDFFKYIFLLFVLLLVFSCKHKIKEKGTIDRLVKVNPETKINKKINIKISRYDKALFSLDQNNIMPGINAIKQEFNIFLNADFSDPVKMIQLKSFINDPMIIRINKETQTKFPDLIFVEKNLSNAFTYFNYYFPEKKIPKVYSYVNFLNDSQPIVFTDSIMIIELDMYIGKSCSFYSMAGFPVYKTNRYSKEYIAADCMREIGKSLNVFNRNDLTFLNQIIAEGKVLFFEDAMLPESSDSIKIGFTSQQLDWCKKNEENLWKLFIGQKLLYKSEPNLISKFLNDAPFTPGFSHETPGRLGCWVGWQIVRDYMSKNEKVTISELMRETDAQKILKLSNYRPRK